MATGFLKAGTWCRTGAAGVAAALRSFLYSRLRDGPPAIRRLGARRRYGPSAHGAHFRKQKQGSAPANNSAPGGGDWDFYGKNGAANDHLETAPSSHKEPAPAPAAKASNSAPPVSADEALRQHKKKSAHASSRRPWAKTPIVLQVAAVKLQRDALEMADAIQQKRFPSFVANSPADNFYHVQVGPYPDMVSAENAKRALEQLGFKPIIKR